MQTLRKKTSPLKYKNETTRFLGDGVSFKAKLIGILEVSEARGDRMCQEALSDLKMAIRAAGEHKQRITINIAIDGLRLRDEKTGDSLYHHPVHKISFIAQDMSDSRAFGYIFGSPDTGHRFFGIKTDKAASQVVIAMRDLFQVVFALKKKEIELAKQHLDKSRYTSSPLFSDSSISATNKLQTIAQESTKAMSSSETTKSSGGAQAEAKSSSGTTAVADLVDLELELNSLQQGLNQMERITPSDPFNSKDDPFGDSFTSYTKQPILPPPPSSGRERSNRLSETSGSVFSPRTPHTLSGSLDSSSAADSLIKDVVKSSSKKKDFSFSHDFNNSSSHDEPSSGDWFTPSAGNSIFEEPPLVPPSSNNNELTKEEKHELTKQEILSQFDVFTDLDPLGTGRSKPYIDKKHFFQELKNPPKKVLNDLVSKTHQQKTQSTSELSTSTALFNKTSNLTKSTPNDFTTEDPFGEDPFVTEDPFADSDFINKQDDPFETEFKTKSMLDFDNNTFKFDLAATSASNLASSKKDLNTFYQSGGKIITTSGGKLMHLHENPSLDMSSESECAPEPPPRPPSSSALMQIKPPPLPPKKQSNDLAIKPPPPRPPSHQDDSTFSHYDYMDNYETAPSSLEFIKTMENRKSPIAVAAIAPPLPVPARKNRFESDFVPERPKKQFGRGATSADDDNNEYLTPITGLLPPPTSKNKQQQQVTVASYLENKPALTTSTAAVDNLNCSLEGLDITLSQLTLSGLNELAQKLNIPANQLSNMTLVQLTSFLSNFIKAKSETKPTQSLKLNISSTSESGNEFPAFKADFAANFNTTTSTATINQDVNGSYDRYAVFRELINEEIKQTKIDTEPEEIQEEQAKENIAAVTTVVTTITTTLDVANNLNKNEEDKYAALREIVETEMKQSVVDNEIKERREEDEDDDEDDDNKNESNEENVTNENVDANINNNESKPDENQTKNTKYNNLIEQYTNGSTQILGDKEEKSTTNLQLKSPTIKTNSIKSPVPIAITEIIQNNARLTSGSLSDVVSGSSPEVDNTGSNSDKKTNDATAESWAIFDQNNANLAVVTESIKEKQPVQSEEGVSPWSSDSKEFGNGSPPDWRGSGERWSKRKGRRDQEGWWDTSAEPEMQYYPPSNVRSTDSYEEEYYECYDRPRRRKQPGYSQASAAGGHSSSSRDVSPWEEEPRRRGGWRNHPRSSQQPPQPHTFEKHRDRRYTDSWDDEEDDYEYEDEHTGRFHRGGEMRHSSREVDRESSRHSSAGSREHDWGDDWSEDRRHGRRRRGGDERWCCLDWDQAEHDKPPARYGSGRWSSSSNPDGPMWRERYYSRESQESPWEDEYANEPNEMHYMGSKRNWKRPSSASEMDRKTGEIKSRHYLGTGGSDGERDRRYKPGRRSRSRDSQYSEPASHRHKAEGQNIGGPPGRSVNHPSHRMPSKYTKPQFENDFADVAANKQKSLADSKISDHSSMLSNKKSATLANRKKKEMSPKSEENVNTFPRKSGSSSRTKSLFENDFVPSEDSPPVMLNNARSGAKFNFENDFETSEAESPTVNIKSMKGLRQQSMFESKSAMMESVGGEFARQRSLKESTNRVISPRLQAAKPKSLFEDDFSPSDQKTALPEDNSISSIKEETDQNEEDDSFNSTNKFENTATITTNASRKKKFQKHRLSNNCDVNLKKSESVNIFARENDPFDDDFFSENAGGERGESDSPRTSDLKWTDDFDDLHESK